MFFSYLDSIRKISFEKGQKNESIRSHWKVGGAGEKSRDSDETAVSSFFFIKMWLTRSQS